MKSASTFQEVTVVCIEEWYLLKAVHAFLYALCRFGILELGRRVRGQQEFLFQFQILLPLSSLAILSRDFAAEVLIILARLSPARAIISLAGDCT